jgi:hypothetical protein
MSPMCACPFGPDELAVETLAIEAGARAEQAPLIEEWLVRHDAEVIERVLARLENWPVYIADEAYHPQVSGEAMFCKADVMAQIRDLIPDTCGDPFCTDAREILADLSEAAKAHDAAGQAIGAAAERERLRRLVDKQPLYDENARTMADAADSMRRRVLALLASPVAPCKHERTTFDRSICARDGWMHTYCDDCHQPLDGECGRVAKETK